MASYIFQKVTDKCFLKCVPSPGTSLGSSDQVCVQFEQFKYAITL